MKATLAALLFLVAVEVSLAYTACQKQSDCEPDECCVDSLFFKRPYCQKRYPAGASCSVGVYNAEKDLYYLTCPCVQMYECLGKGVTENGITYMKDAKCIMPL